MGKLKVSTMNLYNLQIPGKAMYNGKLMKEGVYKGKINWTANALKSIDADIIAFQELWHPDALKDAFVSAGMDAKYELASILVGGEVSVAMAVRKPLKIINKKWVDDFPDEVILKKSKRVFDNEPTYEIDVRIKKFSRAVLRVNVKFDDETNIVCFVTHLKSKLPMRIYKEPHFEQIKPYQTALGASLSTIRRAAEAAALRVMLDKEMKNNDNPIIVMGDLNDSQLSVTTSIITGNPKHRLFSKSRTGTRSDKGLYSVATLQELRSLRDVYYTYIHDGFRESLDHILVSEQFYDYSSSRIWSFQETRIYNDHIDDQKGKGFGSDHGIIVSTFNHDPA